MYCKSVCCTAWLISLVEGYVLMSESFHSLSIMQAAGWNDQGGGETLLTISFFNTNAVSSDAGFPSPLNELYPSLSCGRSVLTCC